MPECRLGNGSTRGLGAGWNRYDDLRWNKPGILFGACFGLVMMSGVGGAAGASLRTRFSDAVDGWRGVHPRGRAGCGVRSGWEMPAGAGGLEGLEVDDQREAADELDG